MSCPRVGPTKHLPGSCHAHLSGGDLPRMLFPRVSRGQNDPEAEILSKMPLFSIPPLQNSMRNRKNINYKSHRSCQTNFSVAVCLKFFTLLRLRKHFLCAGKGGVWNLLSVLSHLPVILYKIPPFFFPFKMQTLKPFYLNRSFRGGVQGAAPEISQMTRLGVQVWGFQGICFLRSSFSPFPHTSEKGESCRKGKKATVFNHRFLRNFLFSF